MYICVRDYLPVVWTHTTRCDTTQDISALFCSWFNASAEPKKLFVFVCLPCVSRWAAVHLIDAIDVRELFTCSPHAHTPTAHNITHAQIWTGMTVDRFLARILCVSSARARTDRSAERAEKNTHTRTHTYTYTGRTAATPSTASVHLHINY